MLSSTSSPRFFLQFMQLSLRHPQTWAHHSQDHLSPDSLSPIAQSSCKSTAVRLGKVNPRGRCPRSQAPPCPSGILQIGSLRTPKDSDLAALPLRSPSGPQTVLPRPRFSSGLLAHLQLGSPYRLKTVRPRFGCPQPRALPTPQTISPPTVLPLPGPPALSLGPPPLL